MSGTAYTLTLVRAETSSREDASEKLGGEGDVDDCCDGATHKVNFACKAYLQNHCSYANPIFPSHYIEENSQTLVSQPR